nr:MAG TPA: hypothetical protein [Caudoviricetes sp.]
MQYLRIRVSLRYILVSCVWVEGTNSIYSLANLQC